MKSAWGTLIGKSDAKSKPDERSDDEKQRALDDGVGEAEALIDQKLPEEEIRGMLPNILRKYRLTSLALVIDAREDNTDRVHVAGVVNPRREGKAGNVPRGGASFKLAPGDYTDHEGNPIPLAYKEDIPGKGVEPGDPIFKSGMLAATKVHTITKHVDIDDQALRNESRIRLQAKKG